MKRHLAAAVVMALLTTACANSLGRAIPACDERTGTLFLQIQSVPGATYVPCVAALPVGWDYWHLAADSSGSTFSIASDRMGAPFLTVQLVRTCNPSPYEHTKSNEPGTRLFKDIHADASVDIVVVPEGQSALTEARAVEIVALVDGSSIQGKPVAAQLDASAASTAERVAAAQERDAHVMTVSIRDVEEGSVGLIARGSNGSDDEESLDEALETLAEITGPPSYTGRWFYAFPGGCAIYTFSAHGHGVETIEEDVAAALDLLEVEPVRQEAADRGLVLP